MPSCLKGHSSAKVSPNNPTNISLKICEGHFFTFAWGRKKKKNCQILFVVVLKCFQSSSDFSHRLRVFNWECFCSSNFVDYFVDPSLVMCIHRTVHLLIGMIVDEFLISLRVSFHKPAYMVHHNQSYDQQSRTAYQVGWKTPLALLFCGKLIYIHW